MNNTLAGHCSIRIQKTTPCYQTKDEIMGVYLILLNLDFIGGYTGNVK